MEINNSVKLGNLTINEYKEKITMKTFIELKKELCEKYGDEFDIRKIYNKLQYEVYKSLNLVFCYGAPGSFGGVGCEHGFSFEEKDWMVLRIIEHYIDYEECLSEIQGSDEGDIFSDDRPWEHYFEGYTAKYETLQENISNLRDKFRNIKTLDSENCPNWVDEWELCLDVDIKKRNEELVDLRNKRMIFDMTMCATYAIVITDCLIERCNGFIERHGTSAKSERIEGEELQDIDSTCPKNNFINRERRSIMIFDERKLLEMSDDELVKHWGNLQYLEYPENQNCKNEMIKIHDLLYAREIARIQHSTLKNHAKEDMERLFNKDEEGQSTIH